MQFCCTQIIPSYTEVVEEVAYLAVTFIHSFPHVSKRPGAFPSGVLPVKDELRLLIGKLGYSFAQG